MKKICVCGSFGFGKKTLNGQTIKTQIVTDYYLEKYGGNEVLTIDTQGLKNFILVPIKLIFAFFKCKNIIILPAHNSLKLLAPLCRFYQCFTKKKTHYFVIGGWLPHYLPKHPLVFWGVRSFWGVYVETNTMKSALEQMGLQNVSVLPNCKKLEIRDNNPQSVHYPPLKLCTFSRINRMKGIGDAVSVVEEINNELGRLAVTLDIFGRVDDGEHEWFEELKMHFPEGVCSPGAIEYDKSVSTLENYHALLFPTRYFTEGIPGTIIDAYAAGLPVIASKWESCDDVVKNQKTGIIYEFENNVALKNTLMTIIDNPQQLFDMKKECTKTAYDYLPDNVMSRINLK